jgi:hypothetical protein
MLGDLSLPWLSVSIIIRKEMRVELRVEIVLALDPDKPVAT